ncbi:hypothetical protein HU200_043949 [Digitaria exilis]|uniref:Exocyst subunit Exo70 family protein n=1 Tax=Digitaria exilis TaxID=1010633 RepID=A0A835BDU9_9POAL|nr:hypothetical protein HU200_043949 [Digitaria exilis]
MQLSSPVRAAVEMDPDDEDHAAVMLAAARRTLRAAMDKSRALGDAVARAGPRLEEIQAKLRALEAAASAIRAPRAEVAAAGSHIDHTVGPAIAALKVFDAVHDLEPRLLAPGAAERDLPGYLAVVAQLKDAHRFLAGNCGLAAQWLTDVIEYLGDRELADPRFLTNLGLTLNGHRAPSRASGDLDGGLLDATLDILEAEFRRLLADHSAPLTMPKFGAATASAAPSRVPTAVVQKLSLILDRLVANGRQDRCVAAANLGALGLDYLRDPSQDAHALRPALDLWGQHLEFVVHSLIESEQQLCFKVFGPKNVASACFAEVAMQAIADAKKDPIKLLRFLEVFDSLNKLMPDFNSLFTNKAEGACSDFVNLEDLCS